MPKRRKEQKRKEKQRRQSKHRNRMAGKQKDEAAAGFPDGDSMDPFASSMEMDEAAEAGPENPAGVHPSMRHSRRYQKFMEKIRAIQEELPEGTKSFGLDDVTDETLRTFLRNMTHRRREEKIAPWQEKILEHIGFDWHIRQRKTSTMNWETALERLVRLLQLEQEGREEEMPEEERRSAKRWMAYQKRKIRAGKMDPERVRRFETVLQDYPTARKRRGEGTKKAKTAKKKTPRSAPSAEAPPDGTPTEAWWKNLEACKRSLASGASTPARDPEEIRRLWRWLEYQYRRRTYNKLPAEASEALESQELPSPETLPLRAYQVLVQAGGDVVDESERYTVWNSFIPARQLPSELGIELDPDNPPRGLAESRGYQAFEEKRKQLRASLPEGKESFTADEIPDEKSRFWVRQHLSRWRDGKLRLWRGQSLETFGLRWHESLIPKRERDKAFGNSAPYADRRWIKQLKLACPPSDGPRTRDPESEAFARGWIELQKFLAHRNLLSLKRRKKLAEAGIKLPDPVPGTPEPPQKPSNKQLAWLERAGEFLFRLHHPEEAEKLGPPAVNMESWIQRQGLLRRSYELADWQLRVIEANDELRRRTQTLDEKVADNWTRKLAAYAELREACGGHPPWTVLKKNRLGTWVSRTRNSYRRGEISAEWEQRLREGGFPLGPFSARSEDKWNQWIRRLENFVEKHGHAFVPYRYEEDPGLAQWVNRNRLALREGRLPPERVRELKRLGVTGEKLRKGRYDNRGGKSADETPESSEEKEKIIWWRNYQSLQRLVAKKYEGVIPEDVPLPRSKEAWLEKQARLYRNGELDSARAAALDRIGFDPERTRPDLYEQANSAAFQARMDTLRAFYREHGHLFPTSEPGGRRLRNFLARLRKYERDGLLKPETIRELNEMGFVWNGRDVPGYRWMKRFGQIKAFRETYGHCRIPRDYPADPSLAEFAAQERKRYRKGLLRPPHVRLLDSIGFEWHTSHPNVGKGRRGTGAAPRTHRTRTDTIPARARRSSASPQEQGGTDA